MIVGDDMTRRDGDILDAARVTLTVDGREVLARPEATVLEACREAGIHIPTLCHDPRLEPYGACRLCIVEIEGMRGFPTSCTTAVAEGMVVTTASETLHELRSTVVELLLSDHKVECLTCESNGRCGLQDAAYELGIEGSRFEGAKHLSEVDDDNPLIARDLAKCISCGRCVRICHEVQGCDVWGFTKRGFDCAAQHAVRRLAARCGLRVLRPVRLDVPDRRADRQAEPVPRAPLGSRRGPRRPAATAAWAAPSSSRPRAARSSAHVLRWTRRPTTATCARRAATAGASRSTPTGSPRRSSDATASSSRRRGTRRWRSSPRSSPPIRDANGSDAIAGLASAKCTNEENYLFQKLHASGSRTRTTSTTAPVFDTAPRWPVWPQHSGAGR